MHQYSNVGKHIDFVQPVHSLHSISQGFQSSLEITILGTVNILRMIHLTMNMEGVITIVYSGAKNNTISAPTKAELENGSFFGVNASIMCVYIFLHVVF